MYTVISIFYASLLGIIVMLLLKRREARTGHPSLVSRLGRGTDHLFGGVFGSIGQVISYINKHTFIAIAHWMAYHVLYRIRNIYVHIKDRFITNPHGKKIIDAVRGRAEVKDHGASFYLRRISDK